MDFQVPAPEEETDHQRLLTACNKCVVEAQELECPEYCFQVPFNSFQHPKYSENIHKLATVIKALSSSIGGVVLLCRQPGQIDSIDTANVLLFKERLETWNRILNPSSTADMFEFVPLSKTKTIWGLVLVKAASSLDLSSSPSIDQLGFVVPVYSNATREAVSFSEESNVTSSMSNPHITAATPTEQESETDSLPLCSTPEPTHEMTDVDIDWQLGNKIAWTTHKKNWHQYVVMDEDISLGSYIRKCATSSFAPRDPIAFSPSHLFETLLGEEDDRNKIVEAIIAKLDSAKAFALVSPSWLNQIGMEELSKRPKHHVGDILVVTERGSVYLWSIVQNMGTDDDLRRTYLMISGRLTKFLLLKGQKEKKELRVDCYLYNLQDNTVEEPLVQQHTRSFFVNNVDLKVIQENLGETIVARETYLRNVTGEACGYKLSAEQWRIADKVNNAPVTVVSGPPGSGKTLLCSHFLQEKGTYTQSLYVCTNEALAAFMKSQNICSVLVVKTDAELDKAIGRGEFKDKICITFDDVHRLSCSDRTAKHLLNLIKRNKDVRLYVFCDNKFQCFDELKNHFPKAVERCCKRMDIDCVTYPLTEIHRNTRRIMSFLSAVSFKEDIKCLHKWEGDDVEVLGTENPLDDSPKSPLVQNILQILGLKDPGASCLQYAAQDIAVLIDTDSSDQDVRRCRQTLRKYIPNVKVHSAATFPRTGIVVDVLDSFHGLDAGVCLYVLSRKKIKKQNVLEKLFTDNCRSIYNPKYLAFLASRAIYKVIFFVPKLNAQVFKKMLFDCFDDKVINVFFFLSFSYFFLCIPSLLSF